MKVFILGGLVAVIVYLLGLIDGYTIGKRHGIDAAIAEIERQTATKL